jgi:hypothetical protein
MAFSFRSLKVQRPVQSVQQVSLPEFLRSGFLSQSAKEPDSRWVASGSGFEMAPETTL